MFFWINGKDSLLLSERNDISINKCDITTDGVPYTKQSPKRKVSPISKMVVHNGQEISPFSVTLLSRICHAFVTSFFCAPFSSCYLCR